MAKGGMKMSYIKVLPPIEKWDSDNEGLYYYGDAIENEDGSYDMEVFRMPFPIEKVFYRRRKIQTNMLKDEQFNNCKYCGEPLVDGYWRRMHMCRVCHSKKPWEKPLFDFKRKEDYKNEITK